LCAKVEEIRSVLKEQREDAEEELLTNLQLNETERRADIISLKGLDVMDKGARELSAYPYCPPNGVQNGFVCIEL